MRERKLIQRRRPLERRKRPGFFRVERPRQLWQLDMTERLGRRARLDVPDGDHRLLHPRDRRLAARAPLPRRRSDRGRRTRRRVHGDRAGRARRSARTTAPPSPPAASAPRSAELGIRHRRGGYRDPESQAFIESWFGKLKEREVWLNEYETLDDARRGIGGYVDRYHHRPHSRLGYRTPYEVAPRPGRIYKDYKNRGLACQHRRGAGHGEGSPREYPAVAWWRSSGRGPRGIGRKSVRPSLGGSFCPAEFVAAID